MPKYSCQVSLLLKNREFISPLICYLIILNAINNLLKLKSIPLLSCNPSTSDI